eukprot:c45803_g1_i1.p2 GENE.c45803_g1_i1~~c45803_g1_i1.p2  ORF type:complete len:277 (-),score=64.66 c45803_g1_i1:1026-1856(-)
MLCCPCVSTGTLGIVERFGKFSHIARPGLNCLLYPVYSVAQTLSLRVHQLDVECETKTLDNVFVLVVVSVQYQIIEDRAVDAAYTLTNPTQQIRSYVFDVVRSTVPQMKLDDVFESKGQIASEVKSQLSQAMASYGYEFLQALVTDLGPDKRVREAMNEINANKRMREAATEKAEAEKLMLVKAAEADAESKYLSGVGVANQRKAIVDGLRDSVTDFAGGVKGTGPKDVINLLMVTQYFDMLERAGKNSADPTLYIPHGPTAVIDLQNDLRRGLRS